LNDQIKLLFERYQAGTATPQERQLVESWFASHDENPDLQPEVDPAVFADLDSRINTMLQLTAPQRKPAYNWIQIAAALLFTTAAALFLNHKYSKKPQPAETFTEIKAIKGVKKEITLQDGTSVYLNSGSSVFVSSRFGEKNRTVKLSGEAFFQVHHDRTKPFIIHTGKLATTVLGTSFDINAYPEDELVKVTVSTGKVKVEGTSNSGKKNLYTDQLVHNQALVYNKLKDSHSIRPSNSDSISSWRSNHLIFENATNQQIARSLSRWYGVEVELSPMGIDGKRYTLSFNNEKADKVMGVLSALTGMTYTMEGKKVMINPTKHK
jgi:transmembrane sensor